MPTAVVHVLLTIIAIDLFRDYFLPKHHLKKFPRWMVLVGGIAGLLPDVDMPFTWAYNFIFGTNVNFHAGVTHAYIFAALFLGVAWLLHFMKKEKASMLFAIIFFGYAFHITLDFFVLGGAYMPLWPFSAFQMPRTFISLDHLFGLDAILLILWLVHEEFKHKIKDYI